MPTKFATEPAKRPDYIPAATTVGGASYPLTYNPSMGGYGYYNGPTFFMYDPFDALAMSAWHSYSAPRPMAYVAAPSVGWSFGGIVVAFCVVGGLGFFIFLLYKNT